MIMMLPFLTALIATWFGMRGQRSASIAGWVVTFVIYLAWMKYHMTDKLNISL
jgi:hypothetical protein